MKSGLRRLVMHGCIAVMEMAVIYMVADLMRSSLHLSGLAFIFLVMLYPAAYALYWLVNGSRAIRGGIAIVIGTGVLLITAVVWLVIIQEQGNVDSIFPVMVLSLIIGLGAWWMGSTSAHSAGDYRYMITRFQIEIMVLMIVAPITGASVWPVILFFVLGSTALVLNRWETALAGSSGILQSFIPSPLLIAGIAGFAITVLLFFIASPSAASDIIGWFGGIFGFINRLLQPSQSGSTTPGQSGGISCACNFQQESGETVDTGTPGPGTSTDNSVVTWLLLFCAYIAVLVLLALLVRRIVKRNKTPVVTTTPSEFSTERLNIWREIGRLFASIFVNLWRMILRLVRRVISLVHRPREAAGNPLSVRGIYAALLKLAARRGKPRSASQTPKEYLEELHSLYPDRTDATDEITAAYQEMRYGNHPANTGLLEQVRRAWRLLRS